MKFVVVAALAVVLCMMMGMSHGLKCYVGTVGVSTVETDCPSGTCMKVATTSGSTVTSVSSCVTGASCTESTVGPIKTTCCSSDLCNAATTETMSRPVLICAAVVSGIVVLLRSFQ